MSSIKAEQKTQYDVKYTVHGPQGSYPMSSNNYNGQGKKVEASFGPHISRIRNDACSRLEGTHTRGEQHFKMMPCYRPQQIRIYPAFEAVPQGGTIIRRQKLSLSKDIRNSSKSSHRSKPIEELFKGGITIYPKK